MNDTESIEYADQVFQAHSELMWARRSDWLNNQSPIIAVVGCITLVVAELFSKDILPEEWANSLIDISAAQSFYTLTIILLSIWVLFMLVIVWNLGFPPSIELEPVEE